MRTAIVLIAALLATTAQAETLAHYTGTLRNSDQMVVALDSELADPSRCRAFNEPRLVDAYLTFTAVTPVTTKYATGCWAMNSVGDVEVSMWTLSTNEPVSLQLDPKDFRKTNAPFDLWPTTGNTLEPIPGYNAGAIVLATAVATDGDGSQSLVYLTYSPEPGCHGDDARMARVQSMNGARTYQVACWAEDGDLVVIWNGPESINPYEHNDPAAMIPKSQFTVTDQFDGWR